MNKTTGQAREWTAFEKQVRAAIELFLRGDGRERLGEIANKKALQEQAFLSGWLAPVLAEHIRQATLTPDTLAAELDVTEYRLRKRLQSEGCPYTPGDLIHQARMQIAVELVTDPRRDRPINEIASACGFDDPRRFSVVFASLFGKPPMEYRNKKRELIAKQVVNPDQGNSELFLANGTVVRQSLPGSQKENYDNESE